VATAATTLEQQPQSVAAGRGFVGCTLEAWGCGELADTACLLASEILTNAVRHAHTPIGLRLYRAAGDVTVEITDDNTHLPARRLADPDDENGRGLMLVESLASAWGARPTRTGKSVWFTLDLVPVAGELWPDGRHRPAPPHQRSEARPLLLSSDRAD
jgi:anti-sigma regulatory factor (Ser/Thr protein kinase)